MLKELIIECLPFLVSIIGIIIVAVAARYGIKLNKDKTISVLFDIMKKITPLFVEAEKKPLLKGHEKLNFVANKVGPRLTKKELRLVKKVGRRLNADKHKPTFNSNIKAVVQEIFTSSATSLITGLIKKI